MFDAEPGDPAVSVPTLLSEALTTARTHAPAQIVTAEESVPTVAPIKRAKKRGRR